MPEKPRWLEFTGQGTQGESRTDSTAETSRATRASPAKDWSAQAWRKLPKQERITLRSTESTLASHGAGTGHPPEQKTSEFMGISQQLWVELCLLESPMLKA